MLSAGAAVRDVHILHVLACLYILTGNNSCVISCVGIMRSGT